MNRQEYLDSALQVIRSNLPGGSTTGLKFSQFGSLLLRAVPGVHWSNFGFRSLSELVSALEQDARVRVALDDRNALAVFLPSEEIRRQAEFPEPNPRRYAHSLRKDVWSAFVVPSPRGRRFLNRNSGNVRMGLVDIPGPPDEWIEILPISPVVQRAWATDFLSMHGLQQDASLVKAIEAPDWYVAMTNELRQRSWELVQGWNRQRSQKVVQKVDEWATANAIPPAILYQDQNYERTVARRIQPEQAKEAALTVAQDPQKPKAIDLRQVLLQVISRLPADALTSVKIPSKYVFEYLLEAGRTTAVNE